MRKYFLFILLLSVLSISAQSRKEKRIYYLDCSYSMKQNKIGNKSLWDEVRNNLENAISNIDDKETLVEIVCFAYDAYHNDAFIPENHSVCAFADDSGKSELINFIRKRELVRQTMTYHDVPLWDFINNQRIDKDRDTYFYLMTDGNDQYENTTEDAKYGLVHGKRNKDFLAKYKETRRFDNLLGSYWRNISNKKNVFGFYVRLDTSEDKERRKLCDQTPYFWYMQTADVDVNTIRTYTTRYSVMHNSSVQIHLQGKKNLYGVDPELNFADKYYDLQYSYSNGVLTISPRIKSGVPAKVIPESDTIKIKLNTKECVKHNNKSQFNIIVDEELDLIVTCNHNPISFSQAKDDIYNVRNSKSFTLIPKGNLSKVDEIIVWFEDSTNLYAKTEIDRTNNKLRIYPLLKTDSTYYINKFSGQSVQDFKIHYSVKSKDPFSYIDGENSAIVKFEGKWEKWLTTSIEACDKSKSLFATISSWLSSENESSLGTITYYPSFLWKEENTTRSKAKWNLTFTKDALGIEGTKVKLEFCDKYGNPLDTAQYKIYVNNKLCDANIFEVTNKMTQLDVSVWMKPGTSSHPWWGTDEFEGNLKVCTYNNLIGINDSTINECTLVLPWTVVYEKELNPLLFWIIFCGIVAFILWILYLIVRAAYRESRPKFRKQGHIDFDPSIYFINPDVDYVIDNKTLASNAVNLYIMNLSSYAVKEIVISRDENKRSYSKWRGYTFKMKAHLPESIDSIKICPCYNHLAEITVKYRHGGNEGPFTIDYHDGEIHRRFNNNDNVIITHL